MFDGGEVVVKRSCGGVVLKWLSWQSMMVSEEVEMEIDGEVESLNNEEVRGPGPTSFPRDERYS